MRASTFWERAYECQKVLQGANVPCSGPINELSKRGKIIAGNKTVEQAGSIGPAGLIGPRHSPGASSQGVRLRVPYLGWRSCRQE
jgi:hypothetical protein